LDWVPSAKTLEPMCGSSLADVLGTASAATATASAVGLSTTTVTTTPFLALFTAGESSLMIVTGSTVSVVTTPVVGSSLAIASAVATTAYVGGKGLCALSSALASTHITNEPIPLVMWVDESGMFTSKEDALLNGQAGFVETGESIPAGTPVLSLGPMTKREASHYPGYEGRGLIMLGQFFDHVYASDIPEEDRGFAVVPANSLNPIFKGKYTHVFTEDTVVTSLDRETVVPAGTPFELLKLRKDGRAEIELADFKNFWLNNLSSADAINTEIFDEVIATSE
jgi:hypothetical protein